MQMRLSARKVTWRVVVPHGLLTGYFQKNVGAAAAAHRYQPYSMVNARGSYAKRRAAASIKSYPTYGDCIYDSPYIKSLRSANCFHDNLSSVSRRETARCARHTTSFSRSNKLWMINYEVSARVKRRNQMR